MEIHYIPQILIFFAGYKTGELELALETVIKDFAVCALESGFIHESKSKSSQMPSKALSAGVFKHTTWIRK